jgi:uncharacterized membrane protein YhaH (DUF805 family)
MAQDWYYAQNNRREGPVEEPLFRDLIARGVVTPDMLVWTDGMEDWAPLASSPATGFQKAQPPALSPGLVASPTPVIFEARASGGPGRPMGFAEAVSSCFSNYATFKGRASRSEFWFFQLFYVLVVLVLMFAPVLLTSPSVGLIGFPVVLFGLALPFLAVTVRRFHDSNKSGWWLLLYIVPVGGIVILIFTLLPPTPGPNSYG